MMYLLKLRHSKNPTPIQPKPRYITLLVIVMVFSRDFGLGLYRGWILGVGYHIDIFQHLVHLNYSCLVVCNVFIIVG